MYLHYSIPLCYIPSCYMIYTQAATQNQKFPFHFLSAPPTPPAEEKKRGKENFWFLFRRPTHGCGTWIRTKIPCSRGMGPAIRRSRKIETALFIMPIKNSNFKR